MDFSHCIIINVWLSVHHLSYCFSMRMRVDTLKVSPYVDVKEATVEKQDSKEVNPSLDVKEVNGSPDKNGLPDKNQARTFTFRELEVATDNFRSDCFLGEGGFGKVYKGYLESPNQVGRVH